MNKAFKMLFMFSLMCAFTVAKGQIITTVAGGVTGHGGYWGDGGPATAAELNLFAGIIADQYNNIYISTSNRIRKVDAATGIINTIAGTGVSGYNGDGIPATAAQLSNTGGCLSFDNNGNLYLYDGANNRIRRIDMITGIISTYAGNGTFGSTGDGGPATAATIDGGDMAWDASGNLYYGATRRIRKITPSGIISNFAGNGLPGVTGDGVPATSTYLAPMRGLAFDAMGNLYCADSTRAIRKIAAGTDIITRVAGTGDNLYSPYSGDGIAATTCHIGPFDISVDNIGNLYIPDEANSRIEKVDTFGIINTIAGTGVAGFSGDNGPATAAEISHPENVVLDLCGNVYIADFNNKRVRKVTYPPTLTTPSISLSGTPSAHIGTTVTINATVTNAGSSYLIHWLNRGIEFTTTTVPSVTYTKALGIDTITARVVSTASYGCYDSTTSAGVVVTVNNEGVSSISSASRSIYPNPVSDVLHIDEVTASANYQLLSIVGSLFQEGSLQKGNNSISLLSLPKGMYILEVVKEAGDKTITKILKQ